jgi:chorismate dehydratase
VRRSVEIRIGAVSYLNTKPLVQGLAERLPQAEIVYDLPSRLADRLAAGTLDVGLIPSVEFFQNPAYSIVSDACIGCRGPVWSVKLFSRVPGPQIRTLALDEGSRTSAALVRILLRERFRLAPQLVPLPIDAEPTSSTADATLLIGDRAIHEPAGDWSFVWDLGDEWNRWSELPFVFAMWTARAGIEPGLLAEVDLALRASRDEGLAHLPEIAEREAAQLGLTAEQCVRYWGHNLHFYLGVREQRGLALFYRHAATMGLAPGGRQWCDVGPLKAS